MILGHSKLVMKGLNSIDRSLNRMTFQQVTKQNQFSMLRNVMQVKPV